MREQKIKGMVLLTIAGIFLVIFFLTRGDIKSFFSIIIVLVCGGLGILYIMCGEKRMPRRKRR
jgi:hypothetical protein